MKNADRLCWCGGRGEKGAVNGESDEGGGREVGVESKERETDDADDGRAHPPPSPARPSRSPAVARLRLLISSLEDCDNHHAGRCRHHRSARVPSISSSRPRNIHASKRLVLLPRFSGNPALGQHPPPQSSKITPNTSSNRQWARNGTGFSPATRSSSPPHTIR